MYMYKHHGTRRYHGIVRNSRNVGKLSACANSGYQALFSDFSNGPGYEAKISDDVMPSEIIWIQCTATLTECF